MAGKEFIAFEGFIQGVKIAYGGRIYSMAQPLLYLPLTG
jgi:hypothetical protein